MPLPTVTDGYYCQIRGALHSTQFAEVTLTVVAADTNPADVGALVGGAWDDEVMPHLSEDYAHTSTLVTPLDGTSTGTETPSETVGGNGNPAVPDQVAIGVTLRSTDAGRSNRGRWYIPGAPSTQVDSDPSLWKTSFVEQEQADVDNFMSAMATGGADLQVLSRVLAGVIAVNLLVVRRQIRTQRRRLTGGL